MQKIQRSASNGLGGGRLDIVLPPEDDCIPSIGGAGPASATSQELIRNRLLAGLSPQDFALLREHLTPVDLVRGHILESPDKPIRYCYFIEHGLVSVVATSTRQRCMEVGIVGREGMTGSAAILQSNRSPNQALVQVAGHGLRIDVADLQNAMQKSRSLQNLLLDYVRELMVQIADSALCAGTANIDERLARWLLMAHDRLDNEEIPLTHAALSLVLGVRRASVTTALQCLQQRNLILLCRSKIIIRDRKRIEASANGAYWTHAGSGGISDC